MDASQTRKSEFSFLSADGMTENHAVLWMPEQEPTAILQIVHGVTEYIDRYDAIAEYFARKGIAVIGHDLPGHGKSVSSSATRMYFGPPGSWHMVVKDIFSCYVHTRQQCPASLPHIILGFSLGSFLVRDFLIQYPGIVKGAVLVGTGQPSFMELFLARLIAVHEGKIHGESNPTKRIHQMTFEQYNSHFQPARTAFDWLCSDKDVIDAYMQDPNRGEDFTCGLFRELIDGMAYVGKRNHIRKMDPQVPLLLISGDQDPVGGFGKGIETVRKRYRRQGIRTEVVLYPGRHDILREPCGNDVLEKIHEWIQTQISRSEL